MKKTRFLANMASKMLAFTMVLTQGLAFAGCSSDNDEPEQKKEDVLKQMNVTFDGVNKPVLEAKYEKSNDWYIYYLYLSEDHKSYLYLSMNPQFHLNKGIDLTKRGKTDEYIWAIDYVLEYGKKLFTATGVEDAGCIFKTGTLLFQGEPEGKIKITLTDSKLIDQEKKEHTLSISYEGTPK